MAKYRQRLVQIAKTELPSLKFDLQNASTHYALQTACQRMFQILTTLVYEELASSQPTTDEVVPRTAPSVPTAKPVNRPPAHLPPPEPEDMTGPDDLPPPPDITQPSLSPSSPDDASGVSVDPSVKTVIMTSTGTRVIEPSTTPPAPPPQDPED